MKRRFRIQLFFCFALAACYMLGIGTGIILDLSNTYSSRAVENKMLTLPLTFYGAARTNFMESTDIHPPQPPGIFLVESTDTLTPQPMSICAVESAARVYKDRPVYFFLKGFKNRTCLQSKSECPGLSLLADIHNVKLVAFDPKVVLDGTPFLAWYDKGKAQNEAFWIRITSNAYRLALIWKHGGLYFDTDVITIRPVPEEIFVVIQANRVLGNSVFGFYQHHQFVMDCMIDFVQNYNGSIWGHQGPRLFTRVLVKSCPVPQFDKVQDFPCPAQNLTFMHPSRFYPIDWLEWEKYFKVWKEIPTFEDSYGLHLWNYMNKKKKMIVPGSNTLAENLFIKYCPSTYDILLKHGQS